MPDPEQNLLRSQLRQAMDRIGRLEETLANKTPRIPARPSLDNIFAARLVAVDSATGKYNWKELDQNADGTYSIKDGGRQGAAATSGIPPFPAYEAAGNKGLKTGEDDGTTVFLHERRDPTTNTPTYGFCWPAQITVVLTVDGGADATTATTKATYTYTVKDDGGNVLATAQAPLWQRPNGSRVAAGYGFAHYKMAHGYAQLR